MTSREYAAGPMRGVVVERDELSEHLLRLQIGELEGFVSSGVPDEWVALTVPGQYQTRYYTVRAWDLTEQTLTLDVVVHADGLVTHWAAGDCVGDEVGISAPKGSYDVPAATAWQVLAGDLTALPAMARIAAGTRLPTRVYAESPDGPLTGYLPGSETVTVTWLDPPAHESSALADVVRGLDWPVGAGYFWMAGESAQMRDIRHHLRRDLAWEGSRCDLMGYWSGARGRRVRAVS